MPYVHDYCAGSDVPAVMTLDKGADQLDIGVHVLWQRGFGNCLSAQSGTVVCSDQNQGSHDLFTAGEQL